jgi:hypothetical protein
MQLNHNITNVVVISDTHVPDRVKDLHPDLIDAIAREHPALIIHAVIFVFRKCWISWRLWPPYGLYAAIGILCCATIWSVKYWWKSTVLPVGVLHGHGGWTAYFLDKLLYIFAGYREERYFRLARSILPQAKVSSSDIPTELLTKNWIACYTLTPALRQFPQTRIVGHPLGC